MKIIISQKEKKRKYKTKEAKKKVFFRSKNSNVKLVYNHLKRYN